MLSSKPSMASEKEGAEGAEVLRTRKPIRRQSSHHCIEPEGRTPMEEPSRYTQDMLARSSLMSQLQVMQSEDGDIASWVGPTRTRASTWATPFEDELPKEDKHYMSAR